MRRIATCLGVSIALAAPLWAGQIGPVTWKAKPDVRYGNDSEDFGGSLSVELHASTQWGGFNASGEGSGTLGLPSELQEGVKATGTIRFGSLDFDLTDTAGQSGFVGSIDGGISVGMETDQDYDNSQLAASAWLGEVNVASQGRWSLLPSIVVHADLLKVGESPVDEEYRSRVRLLGSLKRTLTGRLSLHLDGRGFWEFNVSEAWEQADQDQAHYAAAALSYYLEEPTWLVSGLYLRISDGRIPPVAADQTFVGVGIILE